MKPTDDQRPELLPQGRGLPVGLSRAHQRPGVHPADRPGTLRRRVHAQPRVERLSRASSGAPATGPASRPAGATRVDGQPVAICRLKRVARGPARRHLGPAARRSRPRRTASASPASAPARPRSPSPTTSCRSATRSSIFEQFDKPGGLMRSNIPSFRLPDEVLDEETAMILDMGVDIRYNSPVTSMKALLDEGFDAVFVGVRRPARQGTRHPRPLRRGRVAHPHRHRLARVGRLRPHRARSANGPHHRRRQHRHGLLPHVAAPRRHRHQGHGAPPARVLQGVALGARRRRGRGRRDHRQPRARSAS